MSPRVMKLVHPHPHKTYGHLRALLCSISNSILLVRLPVPIATLPAERTTKAWCVGVMRISLHPVSAPCKYNLSWHPVFCSKAAFHGNKQQEKLWKSPGPFLEAHQHKPKRCSLSTLFTLSGRPLSGTSSSLSIEKEFLFLSHLPLSSGQLMLLL